MLKNIIIAVLAISLVGVILYFCKNCEKNNHKDAGNNITQNTDHAPDTSKTNFTTVSDFNAAFPALLRGSPIDFRKAKDYIQTYAKNVPAGTVRHFWLDASTINYFQRLLAVDPAKIDGVRVYLSEYSEDIMAPDGSLQYKKGTRSIVLVATRDDGEVTVGTARVKRHKDWYEENANSIISPYNYSEPCPPGHGCDEGTTLDD